MKLNSNYKALSVRQIIDILMARIAESIINKLNKTFQHGLELDRFIRLANLHRFSVQREPGSSLLSIRSSQESKDGVSTICLREGTSDFVVYSSSVWGGDYQGLDELLLGIEKSIHFIVDAGANIGTTSLAFSRHYPWAQIIGIEADISNWKLFDSNMKLNNCQNVKRLHAALWGSHEEVVLSLSRREWGYQVRSHNNNSSGSYKVETLTLHDLIKMSPNGIIDILKIDIEGAEENVFLSDPESVELCLQHVRHLAIELHGPVLDTKIKNLLRKCGFALFQTGETTYARNLSLPFKEYK
jgi:FkbM family methyltransferase